MALAQACRLYGRIPRMTGRERVLSAMALTSLDRTPWVPFVGCHGGALIHAKAHEYLRSDEAMVLGSREAIRRYSPDGLPVAFDLQIEAEALGCDLAWSDENPPAVSSHPLASGATLGSLRIPEFHEGRIPIAMAVARTLRREHPDLALYGLVTGPFTLAMHLQGTDLFLNMLEDEAGVDRLLAFTRDVALRMADGYIEAGCDVIALVDPMTSQIAPHQFRRFVSEPVAAVFRHVAGRGRKNSFFVCGHAQQNIPDMCTTRPDNISIDENIPLDFVRDMCLKERISFGGNLPLTVGLLLGTPADAQRSAMECIEIGGPSGFILSPGCDLPYATPPANLEAVAELVANSYRREVARALGRSPTSTNLLDMSDYGKAEKVIVDVITLDSEACAPCQYMVEAVKRVAPEFEGIVEWREHKIKHPDSVQFMTSLMVKNVPTICIDGKIAFVSQIPPKEELVAAIRRRIFEKLHYKIKAKKGELLVLGKTAEECAALKAGIQKAVRELGTDIPVIEITDEKRIWSYGISRTPAVVAVQYKIKAEGQQPHTVALKEWIKELQ